MIAHTTWRDLFYKLAEAHPDCLMLNFTVKVGRALESRKEEEGYALLSWQSSGWLFIFSLLSASHRAGEAENWCLCLDQH